MIAYLLEYNRYMHIVGIAVVLGLAWLLSVNRKKINYWLALKALGLQVTFALLLIKIPAIETKFFDPLAKGFNALCDFAREGARFLFGNLVDLRPDGWGCVFAFRILPLIIFFAAFASILSHYGIIQAVVRGINRIIRPLLGTSGPETLSATSNLILGQTEAPLLIKNYLANMSESQIFVVMVSGMAHMSTVLLAIYSQMGIPMKHMIISAAMGIPGAILLAKIMVPEKETITTTTQDSPEDKSQGNIFDAIFQGTSTGTSIAVIVGAMLLVFIALLPLVNMLIGTIGNGINGMLAFITTYQLPPLSLTYFFGWFFSPFAYLLGLSGTDVAQACELMGIKVTINEFVAFSQMEHMHLAERTTMLLTYALGNFANLSSIGMQVGGISALAPSCQSTLAKLGMRAVVAGSLVGLLSAFIVGLIL